MGEIKQEIKRKKKQKLRKKGGRKPKEREKIERKHGGACSINQYFAFTINCLLQ
jgi:hypothetical protein